MAAVEPASMAARRRAARGISSAAARPSWTSASEGALADAAGDRLAQPALLVGGGSADQVGECRRPRRLGAGTGQGGHHVEGRIDLGDGERRLRGRRTERRHGPPADAGAALAQDPGQVARQDLELGGVRAVDELRQRHHLGLARPGGGDRGGRGDDLGEQHVVIVVHGTDIGPGSLPDAGPDLVELGEERQVESAAQEVDARRAAGAGALADGALTTCRCRNRQAWKLSSRSTSSSHVS